MELLEFTRDLSNLVGIYDRDQSVFIRHAASTIEGIDVCSEEILVQIERHSTARKEMVKLSEQMNDLIQKYIANSETHIESSMVARVASIGMFAVGTLATGISLTPIVIGHRIVMGAAVW